MNPKVEQRVEEDERPALTCNGIVLANPAYHCKPVDLWPNDLKEAKPEWIPPMERYLFDFCRPVRTIADEVRCVSCDRQVTGAYVHLADWRQRKAMSFDEKWPYEGRCLGCGYPARLGHEILSPEGQCLVKLSGFPLFYHPDSTSRIN